MSNETAPASPTQVPLAVDLDGTLIRTDMMWESFVRHLRQQPFGAFATLLALRRGRAYFKQQVAARIQVDPKNIPYHEPFLGWLQEQKASGRHLILATASDIHMARPVAAHVGLFEDVMASDGRINLRHAAKRHALTARFGACGYDYAGNSTDDLGVWPDARQAVVVNAPPSLARRAAATTQVGLTFFNETSKLKPFARALRPLRWMINLIMFIPILIAQQWNDPATLIRLTLAFVAFCLIASAGYLLDDLFDLDADRHHATKCHRPFASGDLPLQFGLLLPPFLFLGALGLVWFLTPKLAAVVIIYSALATTRSWRSKQVVSLDILRDAGLYFIRLVAGHVATGITLSNALLAIYLLICLGLALIEVRKQK